MFKPKLPAINVPLIAHLYPRCFSLSESTKFWQWLKKSFANDVVKDLIELIDGKEFAETLGRSGEEIFAKETILGSLKWV
jgi:hypothetical protein